MSAVVASIGTTHPWNAAGLGLDMQVAASFSVRNLSVVVAVSAQDAKGMHAVEAVSSELVREQLDALPIDDVDVLRVGALVGRKNVRTVAEFIRAHPKIPAVVDPVFGATLGGTFLDKTAFIAFRDDLATAPSVILTPNLDEAARLLGCPRVGRDDLAKAAKTLLEGTSTTPARSSTHERTQLTGVRGRAGRGGVRAVLLKGGHLDGDPIDALAVAQDDGATTVELFEDERIEPSMRGTGCVLAMALACELARGLSLRDAVQSARAFVRSRIVAAQRFAGLDLAY
jgi:hydroxymethylpyrimidine/phosphomethylpyrimidine kinase